MNVTARWAAAGMIVVLLAVAAGAADRRSAHKEVQALIEDLEGGRRIADAAKAAAGRHELGDIMYVYLRGVRVPEGKTARDAAPGLLFDRLVRKELTKAAVVGERKALVELARLNRAVAAMARHHGPAKPTAGLGLRQWQEHADDLGAGAAALEKAVAAGDPAQARAAARQMRNACVNCHADFDAAARVLPPPLGPNRVEDAGVKDVLRLSKLIAKDTPDPQDVTAQARRIQRAHKDLNDIMLAFKPKDKGGIGYGKKGEGIELKLIGMGKRMIPQGALATDKDELIKLAQVTQAVAAIARHYAPARTKGGKGKKDWERYCDDMKKGAADLIKAVKAGKAAGVKTAANDLNGACNGCHADFQ